MVLRPQRVAKRVSGRPEYTEALSRLNARDGLSQVEKRVILQLLRDLSTEIDQEESLKSSIVNAATEELGLAEPGDPGERYKVTVDIGMEVDSNGQLIIYQFSNPRLGPQIT